MTTIHSPRPPSGPPQPPPYNWKATLWLVVGMLIVIGAMGVFMRVIPTPFTLPAPTTLPTPGPTSQPAVTPRPVATTGVAATSAPTPLVITLGATAPTQAAGTQPATVQPAGQPTPAPTGAAVVQPTTRPATAPTTVPTAQPVVEATPSPTVDPALAAEILPAYQHYWQVLDDALATLDPSKLNEVMDGPALVASDTYLEQLRSKGRASVGPEDHSITIVSATSDDAVIHDHIVDHSIFVDSTTREPLPADQQPNPNAEIDGTYYLRKVDGVWKVVGGGS